MSCFLLGFTDELTLAYYQKRLVLIGLLLFNCSICHRLFLLRDTILYGTMQADSAMLKKFGLSTNCVAGNGVHSASKTAISQCSIPTPALLTGSRQLELTCLVELRNGSFSLSSIATTMHLRGRFAEADSAMGSSVHSKLHVGKAMMGESAQQDCGRAIAKIASAMPVQSDGHWTHPAVLDCSLHLAVALANPQADPQAAGAPSCLLKQ